MSEPWRELTEDERAIIERLLEPDFPGRDEIRAQLDHCLVRLWGECNGVENHCESIDFQVDSERLIPDSRPIDTLIPTEGRAMDTDDIPIEVLLFHKDGKLSSLEFVVFSENQKRKLTAQDITVLPPR